MNNLPQKIFHTNNMPFINTGQQALFLLICKKLKQKTTVEYEEIKNIYTTTVQRSEYTSEDYWDREKDKWNWTSRKYEDWEIDNLMSSWLLRALGALIKKGYLLVIPRIEFTKQLRNQEED